MLHYIELNRERRDTDWPDDAPRCTMRTTPASFSFSPGFHPSRANWYLYGTSTVFPSTRKYAYLFPLTLDIWFQFISGDQNCGSHTVTPIQTVSSSQCSVLYSSTVTTLGAWNEESTIHVILFISACDQCQSRLTIRLGQVAFLHQSINDA